MTILSFAAIPPPAAGAAISLAVRQLPSARRARISVRVAVELDVSKESYLAHQRAIPSMDDRRATKLEIRLSGAGVLDRTSMDDLALLEAARLGEPVRLIVVGEISGKGFRLTRKPDEDELRYTCTVKVLSVEAGEIA